MAGTNGQSIVPTTAASPAGAPPLPVPQSAPGVGGLPSGPGDPGPNYGDFILDVDFDAALAIAIGVNKDAIDKYYQLAKELERLSGTCPCFQIGLFIRNLSIEVFLLSGGQGPTDGIKEQLKRHLIDIYFGGGAATGANGGIGYWSDVIGEDCTTQCETLVARTTITLSITGRIRGSRGVASFVVVLTFLATMVLKTWKGKAATAMSVSESIDGGGLTRVITGRAVTLTEGMQQMLSQVTIPDPANLGSLLTRFQVKSHVAVPLGCPTCSRTVHGTQQTVSIINGGSEPQPRATAATVFSIPPWLRRPGESRDPA